MLVKRNLHIILGNSVTAIDGLANTVITTLSVSNQPTNLAVNPITDNVYVVNTDDDTVSVISGR